jgi:hypothetical protein
MASSHKHKEALRSALFSFVTGAHSITEAVERSQALRTRGANAADETEARHVMLEADYERFLESPQSLEMLCDVLDEEGLYPFENEWPREAFALLMTKLIAPKLSISEPGEEVDFKFRFKKGFKNLLSEISTALETKMKDRGNLDHWLVMILNTSFHAGVLSAARNAENQKIYYDVVSEVEEETEPWGKFHQIAGLLDKQLSRETRRRTGLVSDLDY